MEGDEGDAGAGEGVDPAAPGLLDELGGVVAAEEIHVALRPGEGDGGDGAAVDEELFVGFVPVHDGLGGFVDAAVFADRR